MKRIIYKNGDILNGLIFIQETLPLVSPSRKTRKAIFKCHCGNEFDTVIRSVISGNTKSCGCYGIESRKKRFTKHGLRNHPIYRIWQSIKTRCTNKSRADYKYYGGSGISLSKEFSDDFGNFYNYVTSLKYYEKRVELALTLDRVDNTKNYEKGNLRWATRKMQANNRRNNISA